MPASQQNQHLSDPLVSVVMPVYGVEAYLREAIDSVVTQTINFEDRIELILVNDGSPDNSEAICLEYAEKYPKNIIYIKQKNQGLSASRRNGFLKARGVYVHSMDSDDAISANFYEKAIDFLHNHDDEVDFVAAKLLMFEARTGGHYGNYRFKTTRVIDINKEPTALQYHIASVVIKRNAINPKWFDKKLSIGEDARLLGLIVKRKMAYGVVSDITYHYRIRSAGGSLINTQHEKLDFYTETPRRFWKYILDYWEHEDGALAPYIQHYVLHDVQWRLNEQKKQNILTREQEDEYKKIVYETIKRFDDAIILSQKRLVRYKQIALLKRKYQHTFDKKVTVSNGDYYINSDRLLARNEFSIFFGLTLDFIHPLANNTYKIEGFPVSDPVHTGDRYVLETSEGEFELTYVDRVQRRNDGFLSDSFRDKIAFEATIAAKDSDRIRAKIIRFDGVEMRVPIHTRRHTKLGELESSYCQLGNRLLVKKNQAINVRPYSRGAHVACELGFLMRILANLKLAQAKILAMQGIESIWNKSYDPKTSWQLIYGVMRPLGFVAKNLQRNLESASVRITHRILSIGKVGRKPIWIITDRGIGAGDNGEALFEYLQSQETVPISSVFALSKSSPDYRRLKKIGPVINMNSVRYRLLLLRADKLLSSQADEYIVNPYGSKLHHILDLYSYDFVFLQHGVTKNDISGWLNRFSKNIKLFVTAAKPEYESILSYPFYYTEKEVKLLGFPRYDKLKNELTGKNKIILAPTWRKYLTAGKVGGDGKWSYSEDFKHSDYYKFYNNLMNDERILDAFRKNNAVGEFYLHPSHVAQVQDFKGNSAFIVKDFPYSYKDALSRGNLLITDYSSVYFDFSYLRKPIVYTQFDRGYYYMNHGVYEEGYFNEKRDGFGPVATSYDEAVNLIIRCVQNHFRLDAKYKNRIEGFFQYDDRNNSRRVFEAVLEIS